MSCQPRGEIDDEADLDALRRARASDPAAFAEIVDRYTPVLYSLAYRLLGAGRDSAREAVQDIFLKVYRALASFDTRKRFFPWLYTIALNHLRSARRRGRRDERDIPRQMPDTSPRPEDLSVQREGERLAQRALDGLPAPLREAFLLCQVEGLSARDTGEILGVPEPTVRTWVFRARRRMKEMLLDAGWE